MKSQEPKSPSIQVLERSFALLDVLASYPDPVSLKVISEQTGLHPSTTHRILNDLTIGRFVDRPQPGSYRLGMRLLELGNLVKARLDVREAAIAPMRELHKLTHQPVNLSMRQGDEIVYIERSYSERSGMQVVRAIGGRAPLHLTSVGKLFLAHDDPQRVRAYATRTGLAGNTRNSITELPALERELARVTSQRHGARRRGTRARRALHGSRHLRRPGAAGGRSVDLRPRRPPAGRVARAPEDDGGRDLGCPRPSAEPGAADGPTPAIRRASEGLRRRCGRANRFRTSAWLPAAGSGSATPRATHRSATCAPARHRPRREYLPAESRKTMISLRPARLACITMQRPASEM